jgi:hypothetical protein
MVRWEVPPTRRIAFTVVLLVTAASVVATVGFRLGAVTLAGDFRRGGYLLAGALALAAVMRAVLPERYCLGLLVRSRRVDVVAAAALAVAVGLTARIVPG